MTVCLIDLFPESRLSNSLFHLFHRSWLTADRTAGFLIPNVMYTDMHLMVAYCSYALYISVSTPRETNPGVVSQGLSFGWSMLFYSSFCWGLLSKAEPTTDSIFNDDAIRKLKPKRLFLIKMTCWHIVYICLFWLYKHLFYLSSVVQYGVIS